MADLPEGYDARCAGCEMPYSFSNAKSLKVDGWQRYCSNLCAHGRSVAPARRTNERLAFERWWDGQAVRSSPRAAAWAAWQERAARGVPGTSSEQENGNA